MSARVITDITNGQEGGLRIVLGTRAEPNIRGCYYTINR